MPGFVAHYHLAGRPPLASLTDVPPEVAALLAVVAGWAAAQDDVRAVALVGSHARGTAQPDSDVDLVIVVDDPDSRLSDHGWVAQLGDPQAVVGEDWGLVQSLRLTYGSGLEVELGVTSRSWLSKPLDEGTARVIRDGLRRVHDPEGLLSRAVAAAAADRPSTG